MKALLKRIVLRFDRIAPEEARVIQYELSLSQAVYRVFIDGGRGTGHIVFDEEKVCLDELLSRLKPYGVKVVNESRITVDHLVRESLSYREE